MLDSKNILLDIGRGSTQDSAGLSEKVQNIADDSPNGFSAVFGHAAATLKAAESGNALPPSLDDKTPAGQSTGPDTVLVSRTLKGGISLIVGGDEPTDEGLVAFARSQGMDPEMLGLMSKRLGEADKPQSPVEATGGDTGSRGYSGSVDHRFKNSQASSAALPITDTYNETIPAQALIAKSATQAVPASTDREKVSLSDSKVVEVPQPPASLLQSKPLNADKKAIEGISAEMIGAKQPSKKIADQAAQPIAKRSETDPEVYQNIASQPAMTVPLQKPASLLQSKPLSADKKAIESISAEMIGAKQLSKKIADQAAQPIAKRSETDPEVYQNIASQPAMTVPLQAAAPGGQTAAQRFEKNLHIKAETQTVSAKLSAVDDAASATSSPATGNKLAIEPKVAEAFLKLAKDRQHLPAAKVEPIILRSDRAGSIPAPATAPVITAGAVVASTFIEGSAAVTPSVTLAEQMVDRQPEDPRPDVLRRQDDYMQLSRQLADALGKRLSAQIQQGSWRVEMELHPKTLGRVEVQLEMKNGEIEARFIAANAATRDLINEGMPRLREAFQEYGTETAYVDLGTANQGFSDGKSTASENTEKDSVDSLSAASDNLEGATGNGHSGSKSDEDGLDILV